jgi:hypothetical protein
VVRKAEILLCDIHSQHEAVVKELKEAVVKENLGLARCLEEEGVAKTTR